MAGDQDVTFPHGAREGRHEGEHGGAGHERVAAGKRTLTQALQRKSSGTPRGEQALDIAGAGVAGPGAEFPFRSQIESSFGRSLRATAHMDAVAAEACSALGAEAFATGDAVAFDSGSPSLHTAAHEAAHVLQQAQGVQLKGRMGEDNDAYEQMADHAADLVVAGSSAAHLFAGGGSTSTSGGVQTKRLMLKRADSVQLQRAGEQGAAPAAGSAPAAPQAGQQQQRSPEAVQRFLNLCSQASSVVQICSGRFSAWLSSMAVGYSNAWSAHQAGLQSAGTAAKDANALVGSIVSAALGPAASSLWGQAFAALTARQPLLAQAIREVGAVGGGAVQGVAETGVTQVRDAAGAGAAPSPGGFEAMPANPTAWPAAMNVRAEREVLTPAREVIERWQNGANNDPAFDVSFDPVARMRGLAFQSTPLITLDPVNSATVQRSFESAFLREWIETEAANVFMRLSQFSSGKARDRIIARGQAVGMADVAQRLDGAVARGTQEHNQRAIRSGHAW